MGPEDPFVDRHDNTGFVLEWIEQKRKGLKCELGESSQGIGSRGMGFMAW